MNNNDNTVDNNDNNDTTVDNNDTTVDNNNTNGIKRKLILDENGNAISKNELKRRLKAERYVQIKKVF